MPTLEQSRIALPRPPELPSPPRFPIIAVIAPIVASVVLWAVTRSAMTLAFAALGPVIAVATVADGRIQLRRTARRERSRFAADVERTRAAIPVAHAAERRELARASPPIHDLLIDPANDSRRWWAGGQMPTSLRIGSGDTASALEIDGGFGDPGDDRVAATIDALRQAAATLTGAPIVVPIAAGIGIAGPRQFALSAARSVILSLAFAASPASSRIEGSLRYGDDRVDTESWLHALPHAGERAGVVTFVAHGGGRAESRTPVAAARTVAELPRELGTIVEIDSSGRARILHTANPSTAPAEAVWLDYVGCEGAQHAAETLAACAAAEGVRGASALPAEVALSELPVAAAGGLDSIIGIGDDGAFRLDLATAGPHAIVGGTTGSGKSELLLTWVLGMAAARGPDRVTFLFVDFKGGAAFDSLRDLPHAVGVITDLEPAQSHRALSSLRAELRRRERALAGRGLRSIDDPGGDRTDTATDTVPVFPRLVVVVDEYAALVEQHSDLHAAFADIAARGRSLGVHLVLCTQRPAGVVRDGILANVGVRLCLRVASSADSLAVIGTEAAARLPQNPVGRVWVSVAGAEPRQLQVAVSTAADVDAVIERWRDVPRSSAPWLPPLAPVIPRPVDSESAAGIPFGILDLPEQQRQPIARYDRNEHGSVLVVGAGGAGKSAVLAALEAAAAVRIVRVAPGVPALWDAVTARREGGPPTLILIDDLDATIASCQEEYQQPLIEHLTRMLREGPTFGIHLVLTVQRIAGPLHGLAALCASTLRLRMPTRAEYVAAGGDGARFDSQLPPGGGHWRGDRIQVFAPQRDERANAAQPTARQASQRTVDLDLVSAPLLAVVTSSPDRFERAMRELAPLRGRTVLGERRAGESQLEVSLGGSPDILIADPETWQAHWSLFAGVRRTHLLLFDGCSLAELRSLSRLRELPPPFARAERALWLLPPDGEFSRARLVSA